MNLSQIKKKNSLSFFSVPWDLVGEEGRTDERGEWLAEESAFDPIDPIEWEVRTQAFPTFLQGWVTYWILCPVETVPRLFFDGYVSCLSNLLFDLKVATCDSRFPERISNNFSDSGAGFHHQLDRHGLPSVSFALNGQWKIHFSSDRSIAERRSRMISVSSTR